MNMAYCRFENTIKDIKDCIDALEYEGGVDNYIEFKNPSDIEKESIYEFLKLCRDVYSDYSESII